MASLRDGKRGILLFEGEIGHLIHVHSQEYVPSKYFVYAGKFIAHSVVHADFGLVGLSRAIVELLKMTCNFLLRTFHITTYRSKLKR